MKDAGETPGRLVRVFLLGEFQMERRTPEGDWQPIPNKEWDKNGHCKRLLKWQLCRLRRRSARGAILEALWPETEPTLAEHYLNKAAGRLRKLLPSRELLHTFGTHFASGYQLAEQSLLWLDSDAALALLQEAERLGWQSASALPLLQEALFLFERGEMLEGEGWQWTHEVRLHSQQAYKQCRLALAEAYAGRGQLALACTQYQRLREADPLDEEALCQLMTLLQQHGRSRDALGEYQQARAHFEQEGLSLSPATEQVADQIQQRAFSPGIFLCQQVAPFHFLKSTSFVRLTSLSPQESAPLPHLSERAPEEFAASGRLDLEAVRDRLTAFWREKRHAPQDMLLTLDALLRRLDERYPTAP